METSTKAEVLTSHKEVKESTNNNQASTNHKDSTDLSLLNEHTESATQKIAQAIKFPTYNNHAKERGMKPKTGPLPSGQISLIRVIDPHKEEILNCRFDQDSQMIALALTNGYTSVYSVSSGNLISYLDCSMTNGIPITTLRWRPVLPGITSKSILVTGSADGTICHWHINSGKLLNLIQEKDNQILALDYKRDGSAFASAGKDYKVRIYDETTKAVNLTLDRAQWQYPGHCNRIFSLKFLDDEPDLLLSGGWDNNLHIWDLREGRSIACIYGPSISGDAIDCKDGLILTGSSRSHNQIELWDFGTRKLLRTVDWEYGKSNDKLNVFSAQFGKKTSEYIIACGSGVNEARIFDKKSDYMDFGIVSGFSKGLYSVDFAPNMEMFAVAGAEGEAHIIKLTK